MFNDEDRQLHKVTRWRTGIKRDSTTKLGDVLSELIEGRISPQQVRFGPVAELWSELLPAELVRHCEIADISGGQLTVRVDSPAHANELRWCSPELLEQIQRRCPRARIKAIKVVSG